MTKTKTHVYSGFPGDCSPAQLEVLSKFRKEATAMGCTDTPYNDHYLLRFLRARKFDLEKTLEMWRNFIKWRKENNVDDILKLEFPEIDHAKKFYPHGYFRTDKQGRPIFIERVGQLKFDPLTQVISLEKLQVYFTQSYERLINEIFPACSKAKGSCVDQTCYIIDLKDAGLKMFSSNMRDVVIMASKIGQDYYPEVLGNMFIINAPMFFYGIWNLVKPLIDEKTRNKVHIMGTKYHKELAKYIDENDLPDFLGGKVTKADYGENFHIEQGPWKDLQLIEKAPIEIFTNKDQEVEVEIEKMSVEVVEEIKEDEKVYSAKPSEESIESGSDWDLLEVADEKTEKCESDEKPVKTFRARSSLLINMNIRD